MGNVDSFIVMRKKISKIKVAKVKFKCVASFKDLISNKIVKEIKTKTVAGKSVESEDIQFLHAMKAIG
jgi:hypothetical protein